MKELKKQVKEYFCGEEKFFDKAFDVAVTTCTNEIERKIVKHTCNIKKDDLFGDIDRVIKSLQAFQKDGYVEISQEWSSYEENYFIGIKYEKETDDEYYIRLSKLIRKIADDLKAKEKEITAKVKRKQDLEDELRKLKNELRES